MVSFYPCSRGHATAANETHTYTALDSNQVIAVACGLFGGTLSSIGGLLISHSQNSGYACIALGGASLISAIYFRCMASSASSEEMSVDFVSYAYEDI